MKMESLLQQINYAVRGKLYVEAGMTPHGNPHRSYKCDECGETIHRAIGRHSSNFARLGSPTKGKRYHINTCAMKVARRVVGPTGYLRVYREVLRALLAEAMRDVTAISIGVGARSKESLERLQALYEQPIAVEGTHRHQPWIPDPTLPVPTPDEPAVGEVDRALLHSSARLAEATEKVQLLTHMIYHLDQMETMTAGE